MYSAILQIHSNAILVETNGTELTNKIIDGYINGCINRNNKYETYTYDTLKIVCFSSNDDVFIVICNVYMKLRICIAYLSDIEKEYSTRYIIGQDKFSKKTFIKYMNEKLYYYFETSHSDKLTEIQDDICQIKIIMEDNVSKAMKRGEKIRRFRA